MDPKIWSNVGSSSGYKCNSSKSRPKHRISLRGDTQIKTSICKYVHKLARDCYSLVLWVVRDEYLFVDF